MVYTVSCSVDYMLVGYGARIVLSTRPTAACFVSRESGSIMLLLGAFLLYSQFYIINLAGSQLLFRKFRRFRRTTPLWDDAAGYSRSTTAEWFGMIMMVVTADVDH